MITLIEFCNNPVLSTPPYGTPYDKGIITPGPYHKLLYWSSGIDVSFRSAL